MSFLSTSPLLVVFLLQKITGGKILRASKCTNKCTLSLWYGMISVLCDNCSSSLVMAMGCDVDGDIRLDFVEDGETVNQREYRLIQVCLFG